MTMTKASEMASAVYLVLEGDDEADVPEGPVFRSAVDAMNAVANTLCSALERVGQETVARGKLQKLVTMRRDVAVPTWHFTLLIRVPSSVSTTVVEFAKHLARTTLPIAVQRVQRNKMVRPLAVERLAPAA